VDADAARELALPVGDDDLACGDEPGQLDWVRPRRPLTPQPLLSLRIDAIDQAGQVGD
jgi:hypothetical protein